MTDVIAFGPGYGIYNTAFRVLIVVAAIVGFAFRWPGVAFTVVAPWIVTEVWVQLHRDQFLESGIGALALVLSILLGIMSLLGWGLRAITRGHA